MGFTSCGRDAGRVAGMWQAYLQTESGGHHISIILYRHYAIFVGQKVGLKSRYDRSYRYQLPLVMCNGVPSLPNSNNKSTLNQKCTVQSMSWSIRHSRPVLVMTVSNRRLLNN